MTDMSRISVAMTDESPFRDVSFSTDDFVGSGQLGAVYRGAARSDSGAEVDIVVKIPRREDKFQEARDEYEVLSHIGQALPGRNPVPDVGLGHLVNSPLLDVVATTGAETPVVVMPYYEDRNLLSRHVQALLDDRQIIKAELLALDAAIALVDALDALHELEMTCTDRKIKDFYVTGADEKIVIIDWNVLRDDTKPMRAAEVALFGYLWHELYLGSKGQVPYMPFKDSLWHSARHADDSLFGRGLLSVGMRMLMAQFVASRPENQPVLSLEKVRRILHAWRALLADEQLPSTERIQVMVNIVALRSQSGSEIQAEAILHDLAWRKGRLDDLSVRDEAMQAAHEDYLGSAEDGARQEIAQAYRIDPADAGSVVDNHLQQAQQKQQWRDWSHFYRWQLILQLFEQVSSSDIDRRERSKIQDGLYDVGMGLHRNPLEDAEQLDSLDEIAATMGKISEELAGEWPQIQAIQAEIRVRRESEMYRLSRSIVRRNQILKEIGLDASQLETHYLAGPAGQVPSADETQTLLYDILGAKVLRELRASLEQTWQQLQSSAAIDPQAIETLQATALLSTRHHAEETLIQRALRQDLHAAWLVKTFSPMQTGLLLAALRQITDLLDHEQETAYLHDMQLSDSAREIVLGLLTDYLQQGIAELKQAMTGGWRDVLRVAPVYRLLRTLDVSVYGLQTVDTDANQQMLTRFKSQYAFSQKWLAAVEQLAALDPKRKPPVPPALLEKIIRLLDENQRMETPMTQDDLLGSPQLQQYRHLLETEIDERIRNKVTAIENDLQELIDELQKTGNAGEQQLKALQKLLTTSTGALKTRRKALQQEISILQEPVAHAELYQLIHNFDLNTLRARIKDPSIEIPADVKQATHHLHVLQTDNNLSNLIQRTLPGLTGETLLAKLVTLRNMLLRNQMPEAKFPTAGSFFNDEIVQNLAETNDVMRRLVDLYQTRLYQHLEKTTTGSLTELMAEAGQYGDNIRKVLNGIANAMHSGEYATALKYLEKLEAVSHKLQEPLIQQSVEIWHTRYQVARQFLVQINLIRDEFDDLSAADDKYLDDSADIIELMIEAMQQCPGDCFSPHLKQQWGDTFNNMYRGFIARLKTPKVEQDDSRMKKIKAYGDGALALADERVARYREIYGLNKASDTNG